MTAVFDAITQGAIWAATVDYARKRAIGLIIIIPPAFWNTSATESLSCNAIGGLQAGLISA